MDFLLIRKEEIRQVISMEQAMDSVREALLMYSRNQEGIPQRIKLNLEKHRGKALYMPGYVKEKDILGIKVVSVYPENGKKSIPNVPATMMLSEPTTGRLLSLMDGIFLTELRTGAISGVATDLLANKEAKNFLLIGTGGQAESQLEAVMKVRPLRQVRVFDIDPVRGEQFIEKMKKKKIVPPQVDIAFSHDLERDVECAQIITAVTTAAEPVFNGKKVQPGTHINGVGSYTPQMSEIPQEVLVKAEKIYVDTKDAVKESGDFQKPIAQGQFRENQIAGTLGQLLEGRTPGRKNSEEITFFETTGHAIFDLVVAQEIYVQAQKKGIGTRACL